MNYEKVNKNRDKLKQRHQLILHFLNQSMPTFIKNIIIDAFNGICIY